MRNHIQHFLAVQLLYLDMVCYLFLNDILFIHYITRVEFQFSVSFWASSVVILLQDMIFNFSIDRLPDKRLEIPLSNAQDPLSWRISQALFIPTDQSTTSFRFWSPEQSKSAEKTFPFFSVVQAS